MNMTYLVDYRIDSCILSYLDEKNISYIKTLKKDKLYEEINGHPDIVACRIADKVILEKETFNYVKKYFSDEMMKNIIPGEKILDAKYPNDIAYNVVATKKYLIGNLKYTDDNIIKKAKSHNLKMIDVNQGYARCSTLILNDETFITSDRNIYKKLSDNKVKAYYVDIKDIYLSERYSGFLGGASVFLDDEVIFFGDIETSAAYSNIQRILEENKIKYKSFKTKLSDYGSMIRLY